jgi:hypothetical protein
MSVLKAVTTSANGALRALSQNAHNVKSSTAAAETLTAAEFVNGVIVQSGTPGAASKTTPTAAAIVALIRGCAVGTQFDFVVDNQGDNTITLVAGSGVTISGTATCATTKTKLFRCYVTNVTAGSEAVRAVALAQLA